MPRVSPTPSNTPTISPSLSPTGTVCPGLTPTATPTNSLTPSITASNTQTPSPTKTPTSTPGLSATPTLTPTNTPSTTPCYSCYEYTFGPAIASGLVVWQDCDGITRDTFVEMGNYYFEDCSLGGVKEGTMTGIGPIVKGNLCSSNCPTPTPTASNSPTPSISPSNDATPTPTPSISETPTQTPTIGETPTQTPSNSPTPSETPPIPQDCFCYFILNETGGILNYTYWNCQTGEIPAALSGGQNIRVCSSQYPIGDSGITIIPCVSVTNCTTNTDCTGCSF